MRDYRFDQFRFDAVRCELFAGEERIALRPQTATLLGVLLRHAGKPVAKSDLIEQVWQRRYVQDQSVFQAISELRAALKPLDAIRTHPNLGYAWVQPLRNADRAPRPLAYAAGIALLLLANGATLLAMATQSPRPPPSPALSTSATAMPPALRAFSIGMEHLQAKRFATANEYFALASREHPAFLEAQLMAAEAALAEGDIAAARERANLLMGDAQAQHNRYLLIAALDVLSRAALAQGQQGSALDLAKTAAGNARQEGYACAAIEMEARVASITNALAKRDAPGRNRAEGEPQDELAALAHQTAPSPDAHCAAITPHTSHRQQKEERSILEEPSPHALCRGRSTRLA